MRLTYSNVFVLHVPNTLQNTSADGVAKIFIRGIRMNIAKVNGSVQCLCTHETLHREFLERREKSGGREGGSKGASRSRRGHGDGRLLSNDGLRRSSLSLSSSGLLGFGNIGTAVFAIIDALTDPSGFRWQGVDNLDYASTRAKRFKG